MFKIPVPVTVTQSVPAAHAADVAEVVAEYSYKQQLKTSKLSKSALFQERGPENVSVSKGEKDLGGKVVKKDLEANGLVSNRLLKVSEIDIRYLAPFKKYNFFFINWISPIGEITKKTCLVIPLW